MPVTAFVSSLPGLCVLAALLGLWCFSLRRRAGAVVIVTGFILVVGGWLGLHEIPPLGWVLIGFGFLAPLAAARNT